MKTNPHPALGAATAMSWALTQSNFAHALANAFSRAHGG
jgi:hypothetical protein